MMPDLGKYAVEVMGSYGGSLLALALLCVVYIRRSSLVKRALITAEARKDA
jgi:heme exporter protein D